MGKKSHAPDAICLAELSFHFFIDDDLLGCHSERVIGEPGGTFGELLRLAQLLRVVVCQSVSVGELKCPDRMKCVVAACVEGVICWGGAVYEAVVAFHKMSLLWSVVEDT